MQVAVPQAGHQLELAAGAVAGQELETAGCSQVAEVGGDLREDAVEGAEHRLRIVHPGVPSVDEAKPAADEGKPAADEEKPAADEGKPAADEDKTAVAAGPPVLQEPTFEQAGSGWRLTVRASGPVGFKYFRLKKSTAPPAPPRLVIDVKGATWTGPSQVASPAPFVSRIRFGKQPDAIRLVLDFKVGRLPKYAITKGDDALTVRFP